jgi:hypothetical protein
MLRKIFRMKRDDGSGERRILHNKKLCNLYSSSSAVMDLRCRRLKWVECRLNGGRKGTHNECRILVRETSLKVVTCKTEKDKGG